MKTSNEWMNISDLMSALMIIFLFISVAFMLEVKKEQDSIRKIAMAYRKSQKSLNLDLNREFKNDLRRWNAEITKDNIIRFHSPDVLFEIGESKISSKFKDILNDFYPRYIELLTSYKYENEIDEIRIEGHTSSQWNSTSIGDEIYLKNMRLSQKRANNVLVFCYQINNYYLKNNKLWLEKKLRANGMAYAKPILNSQNIIDDVKSRRVEFRVLTKAQDKIYKIIETIGD